LPVTGSKGGAVPGEGVSARGAASQLWFEDVVPGASLRSGPHEVTREEIIEFARQWDPFPFHVDEAAAGASAIGGLCASGIHILAIKQRLLHRLPVLESAVASLGYDEVRFLRPVHPGARLTLVWTWGEKRESRSRPDRGVVQITATLEDADGGVVFSYRDNVLMLKRPG
jgi:acyl dehydratase